MDASNPSPAASGKAKSKGKATHKPRPPGTETYWISLAAREDAPPFAQVRKGAFVPNALGKLLTACWRELRRSHGSLVPDVLAVGPHSLHGILFVSHRGAEDLSLAGAVRLFKAVSGRRLAELAGIPVGEAVGAWKKGYTERRLNGARELASARKALKAGLGMREAGVTGTRR
jgi:hypothetical protein